MTLRHTVLTLALLIISISSEAANLTATPQDSMFDQAIHIQLTGLKPDELVTLALSAKDIDGKVWTSSADYHADLTGAVDPSVLAPLAGSYADVDGMGLFWSMRPPAGATGQFHTLWSIDPETHARVPQEYLLTASSAGTQIAALTLKQHFIGASVEVRSIREKGFVADLYYPSNFETDGLRHPAIITLGGSEGGIEAAQGEAAWLASHGFVVLALAWYRMPTLPKDMVQVPVGTIGTGIDYLEKQPFVDADSLGIMGISWGGILALYAGAHFPHLHVVVSLVGGPIVGQGIRRDVPPGDFRVVDDSPFLDAGNPVPFVTFPELSAAMASRDWTAVAKGLIPVWKTNGPILFVAGGDDKLEFSAVMASLAIRKLSEHNHPYADQVAFYPNAGHLITPGFAPTTTRSDVGPYIQVGGTPIGYAVADADCGPTILVFLRQALVPTSH